MYIRSIQQFGSINFQNKFKITKKQSVPIKEYCADSLTLLANYKNTQVIFTGSKFIDAEKLKSLDIPNFHIIENNCARGESLSSKKNRKFIIPVKKCGIENIIDLRDKYSSTTYSEMCQKTGLKYHHIPIDADSVADREIIDNLSKLFDVLDYGKTYIACAQGLHRTDIALALNYIFNPKKQNVPPVLYGHFRDYGLKTDDISRRINSIKKEITIDDINSLGWDINQFEDETNARKKELFGYNSQIYDKNYA